MHKSPARYLLQVLLVAALTTGFVLATDAIRFRHPANLLWMFALPALLGFALNRGPSPKLFMTITLPIVSLAVGTFVGVNFTSYG